MPPLTSVLASNASGSTSLALLATRAVAARMRPASASTPSSILGSKRRAISREKVPSLQPTSLAFLLFHHVASKESQPRVGAPGLGALDSRPVASSAGGCPTRRRWTRAAGPFPSCASCARVSPPPSRRPALALRRPALVLALVLW